METKKINLSTKDIAFFKEIHEVDLLEEIKRLNEGKNYEIVVKDDGVDWSDLIKESDEMYRREVE